MSGIGDNIKGAVKETLGKFTGNESKQQEGHEQRAQGVGQQKLNQEENYANDNTNNKPGSGLKEAGGAAKENLGYAVGNPGMEQSGRQARAQGKGEQHL
ncbi:hypothetical protein GGI23_004144 [Coemansia sp. RSA 2559]|nr:hypothetical protein GGI23_004144 [Coemansia sp. RSA 2559]KAJ2855842.1 hypothetical protein GGI22_003997 [Coemansia erecta]